MADDVPRPLALEQLTLVVGGGAKGTLGLLQQFGEVMRKVGSLEGKLQTGERSAKLRELAAYKAGVLRTEAVRMFDQLRGRKR